MGLRTILLVLLSVEYLRALPSGSREYVLVRQSRSWPEAQDYCQQNYEDFAAAQSNDDWSEMHKIRSGVLAYVWIGLYDNANSWRWSFQNQSVTFLNWDSDQPNNLNGHQFCVTLQTSGYWWDESCNVTCPFFCQNGEDQPVYVTSLQISWSEAQSYCRGNYVDLLTVRSSGENDQITQMIQSSSYLCAWIGLFRESWTWLDQTPISPDSPLRWDAGQPDNSQGQDSCGALDYDGLIMDEGCSKKYFFLCQTVHVKKQVLRLEVKAGSDVNVIAAAVLNKVQQKLRDQGVAADVTLAWRKQPDGTVFQEISNTSSEEELRC